MSKNHILVFETLKEAIDNFGDKQVKFSYLNRLTERALKNAKNRGDEFLPDTITRLELHAITYDIPLDEAKKDRDKIKKNLHIESFKDFLSNFLDKNTAIMNQFKELGFFPFIDSIQGGGSGNESEIWLDIKEFDNIHNDENNKNKHTIKYERQENSLVETSLFMRFIFDKNNELKMFSLRGIFLILFLIMSFIASLVTLIHYTLILFDESQSSILRIISGTFSLFIIQIIRELFLPIHNLITNRIIKSPSFFISINRDNADIEFYRYAYKKNSDKEYNIARITEIRSVCPICTAPIILMDGKPDQSAPLVGRCIEAPHAHVYSFDRMLMMGYFLGHPTYLQESQSENEP